MQAYTGEDERLNIGPKSFTGEKYGGVTYWDTEAYCLLFFLGTASKTVARNLLLYRYKHLQKAIENAAKLGFKNGAALYPMVTINGEECHNERETVMVVLNKNEEEQTLPSGRFEEITTSWKSGADILSGARINDLNRISIPARSAMIIELK